MNPTVIGALIGSFTSILVCLINQWFQNRRRRKDEIEKEKQNEILEAAKEERLAARLNAIEQKQEEVCHKLDIHNGYAEKIGAVQQDIAYIKGKMEKGVA